MNPGGEIGPKVVGFIRRECQRQKPAQVEACVSAVQQKLTSEMNRFCLVAAPQAGVPANRCEMQLLKSLWTNSYELRLQLRGKMRKIARLLETSEPLRASNQTTHSSLTTLIEKEVALFSPTPNRAVFEKVSLAETKFRFTHIDEWRRVETTHGTNRIAWYYWLMQHSEQSYTLYWSHQAETNPPSPEREHLFFQLTDGFYPKGLTLKVYEGGLIQLTLE